MMIWRPWVIVAAACAPLLAAAALYANANRACQIHDAPYVEFWCDARADADPSRLLERLGHNPADIDALKLYARAAPPPAASHAVQVLAALSPADAEVLRLRATDLVSRGRFQEAVEPLVLLAEYHASDPAAAVLARLVGAGQWTLLQPHLRPGNRWLGRVLTQLPPSGAPLAAAMPLVAQALRAHAIDPAFARQYLRELRDAGNWTDAYVLWIALQNTASVPVLFNAGFDEPFAPDGFDWEVLPQPTGARAGAVVERVISDSQGGLLQVRLTGKRFTTPLLRQYLFAGETPYRLRGQYKTRQLRMENGLAWTARCAVSGTVAGRSPALLDSQDGWRPFELQITPPPGCGPVVSLELETFAPFEAETGGVGQIEFDAFVLEAAGGQRASR